MTKRREPLTYQATLESVAKAVGWELAGGICGVSARAVRLWSDHDCETEIRMIDAERLDRAFLDAGGEHAPFHRLMALRLDIAGREAAGLNIASAAGVAAKEAGEAVAAMILLSANPQDPAARREACQQVQEALEALSDSAAICSSSVGGNGS